VFDLILVSSRVPSPPVQLHPRPPPATQLGEEGGCSCCHHPDHEFCTRPNGRSPCPWPRQRVSHGGCHTGSVAAGWHMAEQSPPARHGHQLLSPGSQAAAAEPAARAEAEGAAAWGRVGWVLGSTPRAGSTPCPRSPGARQTRT